LLCYLSFETWLLPKGRQREEEGDRMHGYFCMTSNQKVWWQKKDAKTKQVATGGRRHHQARCY
jgi:hypothetical protein